MARRCRGALLRAHSAAPCAWYNPATNATKCNSSSSARLFTRSWQNKHLDTSGVSCATLSRKGQHRAEQEGHQRRRIRRHLGGVNADGLKQPTLQPAPVADIG